MSNSLFLLPKTNNQVGVPLSNEPNIFYRGTHHSTYGVGGFMEVMYLSDLSNDSQYTGILYGTIGSTFTLLLNPDNYSCGKRRIGMVAYVHETDTTYQFQYPNYINVFTAATASTVGTARVVVFQDYNTSVYDLTPEANTLISGWTNDSIEGISGATSITAGWRVFTTTPTSGSSLPYVRITGDTMTGPLNVPSIYTPTIYLGLDSSGNTRTLDADSSIFDFDILDGGDY